MGFTVRNLERALERPPPPWPAGPHVRRAAPWREPPLLPWLVTCGPLAQLLVAIGVVMPLLMMLAMLFEVKR